MKAEKWNQLKELFSAALERDPGQRSAFLLEACGRDDALRAEVESLLSSYGHADSFIERPAGEATLDTPGETPVGQRIGSYQVIREIGTGGMAVVYLAVRADDQYRKRVAIKLVKKGLDLEEIPRRFRNERQTLAALDHPNIVKLLDGGSTQEGLPYLVMDYVEGMPITEYGDSRRLSINERLELFRTVCGAVHYAHQNLVIHRDLKPGNILVTAGGVPKLLDFGIAKLLNPEVSAQTVLVTQADQRLMTPEYASPEQVRSQPITTATDVYSLGVLLYELLTGHRPYRLKDQSLREIEWAICEVEPEKPSSVVTHGSHIPSAEGSADSRLKPALVSQIREGRPEKLRRRLLGDLDNVVLMALRKEPQRRYASVEQLSQDIRRHLEGLPVAARPATLRYRASKFVRRHPAGVAAAAAVLLILLAGMVITTREARIARTEKARAERRFNDVRHLANSFLFEFHDAIKNLSGATPARRLVVAKALEYLNGLAGEASGDPALQAELAEAYLKVGDVQGNPYIGNLGDTPGALESYGKALDIAEKLAHDSPKNDSASHLVARSQKAIGEVLALSGQPAKAAEVLRQAIPSLERLFANKPSDVEVQLDLADCYNSLGDALGSKSALNLGDKAGAAENFQKALVIYQRLAATDRNNPRVLPGLAVAEEKIGETREADGAMPDAGDWYGKALSIYENLITADTANARRRKDYGAVLGRRGMVRQAMGDKPGALKDLLGMLEIDEALSNADPQNMQLREALWVPYAQVGDLMDVMGDKAGTLRNYRKALAIMQDLVQKNPTNLQLQAKLSDSLLGLGVLLVRNGNEVEGAAMISRGLQISKGFADRPEATARNLNDYALNLLNCDPGAPCDGAAALPYAKRAVEMTKGNDPDYLDSLAAAYFKTGEAAKAVDTEQQALLLLPPATPQTAGSSARKQYEANLAKFKKALHKQ